MCWLLLTGKRAGAYTNRLSGCLDLCELLKHSFMGPGVNCFIMILKNIYQDEGRIFFNYKAE